MNSNDFCIWLEGYLNCAETSDLLERIKLILDIKNKLKEVNKPNLLPWRPPHNPLQPYGPYFDYIITS